MAVVGLYCIKVRKGVVCCPGGRNGEQGARMKPTPVTRRPLLFASSFAHRRLNRIENGLTNAVTQQGGRGGVKVGKHGVSATARLSIPTALQSVTVRVAVGSRRRHRQRLSR